MNATLTLPRLGDTGETEEIEVVPLEEPSPVKEPEIVPTEQPEPAGV